MKGLLCLLVWLLPFGMALSCGTDQQSTDDLTVEEYLSSVREAFVEVSVALEVSGSSDNVNESGRAAWRAFEERLRDLEPPTSLAAEHQALVNSIDRLRTDTTQDGLLLAEAVTAACVELIEEGERLGVEEDIPC